MKNYSLKTYATLCICTILTLGFNACDSKLSEKEALAKVLEAEGSKDAPEGTLYKKIYPIYAQLDTTDVHDAYSKDKTRAQKWQERGLITLSKSTAKLSDYYSYEVYRCELTEEGKKYVIPDNELDKYLESNRMDRKDLQNGRIIALADCGNVRCEIISVEHTEMLGQKIALVEWRKKIDPTPFTWESDSEHTEKSTFFKTDKGWRFRD